MRPKGRGPADASTGGKKHGKTVKEEEETLQVLPQRKDDAHALPASRGDDGLGCPGPERNPPDPEKGDSETASEEGCQMDHRLGQGPSTPAFGGCRPQVGEMPHWCLECGKNFGRKAELEKHQLNHARPCTYRYICGDCGRSVLDHVGCAAGTAFYQAGCRKRTPPFASGETVVQRKERKELSLQEKVRVLEVLEGPKVSQSELAKRFGVSQPQICRIIKNKERILAEWCKSANPGRKRKLEDKGPPAGETALFQWFQRSCASTDRVLVQGAAGCLSEGRGQPEGGPRRGWMSSFGAKQTQGASDAHLAGSENGEQAGEDPWEHTVLPGVLGRYAPPDIYACGEVGLLFRATPGDLGQERREEQLTVLLCANMDASDKREVLVVGKSQKPFGSPGLGGPESPPAAYQASPKAWMTAPIFAEWLWVFNEEMQRQGRSVALCLVPCAAHPSTELSNVSMVFMPPRPSRHNPLEQGVAQSFRCHYRRRLLVRLLAGVSSKAPGLTSRLSERLSLWDAMHLIVQAWAEVCPQTIMSCFQAAGFSSSPPFPTPPTEVGQALGFQRQEQFQQFVLVDDGLECFGNPDDAKVVKGDLWGSEIIPVTGEEVEEEEAEAEMATKAEGLPLPPCPTRAEVTESLAKLRRYLECHSVPPASFQAFYALEDVVHEMLLAGRQAFSEALARE